MNESKNITRKAHRAGITYLLKYPILSNFAGSFIYGIVFDNKMITTKEFEIFFRRLYLPLGMYALRIVDDADVAEDMVQEAFMNTWERLEGGLEISNFKAFMYRSVRNECLSYLSSLKEKVGEEFIPEAGEEEIDTSFRDARIWKAIDELPEKCREIFLMSKRDGYSNEEIADELGISIKTVKNQMTKAFSRLREALSSGHKPFFLPFL